VSATPPGESSTVKLRSGPVVPTVMLVVSPVGLPVKRATRSRLSTTSAATGAGIVAAGSATS
jgi:hypothetical protein